MMIKLLRRVMNLKASDQVQFFKGAQSRLCTVGTACLIWKIQYTLELK